ncbi:MAG TPA: DNA cytosine methyltransferase, partial [Staphylococcus kloosii]
MKFIDMFSGIGGFRTAMENNGHECIAYSEIDKYAKQSYQAMYDTENEIDLGDITNISQEYLSHFKKDNDMVVGGSPCQSFSVAGKQAGFEDTRGTLFFEYAKVVKETQPKYFLFENVKGMTSHDQGNTIRVVLETFNELGYYIDFNVFNSKYYGVPQNRERIYILGKRKDLVEQPKYHDKTKGKKKFDEIHNWAVDNINYVELLPTLQTEVTTRLVDVLEDEVDEKYYLSDEKVEKLTLDNDLGGDKRITMPVLTPDRLNKRQNGRRFKEDGEPMFTLTAEDRHGIAVREATKQGYALAERGDSVNVSYPTSKTRRGRVGKQVAQTLQAGEVNQGVVIDDTQNFYAKDNVVYDEEQYKKLVKDNNDFEVDYIYVEPTLYQLDEKHILLINNDQNQFEVIEIREGYYLTLKVASSLDEL